MNPNERLQAMRDAVTEWQTWPGDDAPNLAERMAVVFADLDRWLSAGNSLPDAWEAGPYDSRNHH